MQHDNFTATDCFWFAVKLWKASKRKLIVVWDNLKAHQLAAEWAKELGMKGLKFVWLPTYAPELNPVECLWSSVKWGSMGNFAPDTRKELEERVEKELASRKRRHRFLKSLMRQPGLKA